MTQDLFLEKKQEAEAQQIEEQVKTNQKNMDYQIREYPVELIVAKITEPLDVNEDGEPLLNEDGEVVTEWFIPDYQREYIWFPKQKSRFIESLIIDLPVPFMFVADIEEKDARLEIIDGAQRIGTLKEFLGNELILQDLEILTLLNGYSFEALPKRLKIRFHRKTIRTIELSSKMDEAGRREMFKRLNSGTTIRPIERRRGSEDGPFLDMIQRIARENVLFEELCPITDGKKKHREDEELLLRFFAYLEDYQSFDKSVDDFLTDYLKKKNNAPDSSELKSLEAELNRMLGFIQQASPMGFRKTPKANSVPRIRFEALAIGTALALREQPDLSPPEDISTLLDSIQLKQHTRADASNSRPRLAARLELVRDFMLGKDISDFPPPASRQPEVQKTMF